MKVGLFFTPLMLHSKLLKHYVLSDQLSASSRAQQSRKCYKFTSIQTQHFNSAILTTDFASHLQFSHKRPVSARHCPGEAEAACDGAAFLSVPRGNTPLPFLRALGSAPPSLPARPLALRPAGGTKITSTRHRTHPVWGQHAQPVYSSQYLKVFLVENCSLDLGFWPVH